MLMLYWFNGPERILAEVLVFERIAACYDRTMRTRLCYKASSKERFHIPANFLRLNPDNLVLS